MSIQTNYPNSPAFNPGRNALVPVSSPYAESRAQYPYVISQGVFANRPFHQDDARTINTEIPNTELSHFLKEGKALGAIHIMIALVHFGLGIILGLMIIPRGGVRIITSYAVLSGYPFWGGLCFLVTGVIAILGVKQNYSCLIKGGLGMSIASAVLASVGVILLLVDALINKYPADELLLISGKGMSSLLIIFSLLELFISSATAHVIIGTISQKFMPF